MRGADRAAVEPTSASASPAMSRAMALRPDGCGSASDSARTHEAAPGAPFGESRHPLMQDPDRVKVQRVAHR